MARQQNHSKKHRATHEEKLRYLSQFKRVSDPTNKSSVSRQYNELKRVPLYLQQKTPKSVIAEAKRRGFFTTTKGLIVDGPRDGKRQPIAGASVRITRDATVVWSVKQRRDYIVGFTRKEKAEFAKNPEAFTEKKIAQLRKRYRGLGKTARSKIQVRLQWGAYQAQKDFSPGEFARLTTWQQFRAMYGVGRKRKKGDVDRLTGFHVVIHVPRSKKRVAGKKKKSTR